jgi:glycosyltransferase involved in cell wall biosynthesis
MPQIKSKCSLCISTYNWPGALYQCLQSIKMQSVLPCEVIIGDDGSADETKALINRIAKDFPVPIIHLWHQDKGYRLAAMRNKAFAKASGDYIIQSDGDIIFHRHFIKDHLQFAAKGTFVSGSRCLLNSTVSEKIIAGKVNATVAQMRQHSTKKYNSIRFIAAAYLNYILPRGIQQVKYVLGANMAFWKADIIKVNGYNETYTGWGKEDNDIALRLYLSGVAPKSLKFAAVAFHIYHAEVNKDNLGANQLIYEQAIKDKITFAASGINQYL